MREFPSLKTMVDLGVYTLRQCEERFSAGEPPILRRKNIIQLKECDTCDFVFAGYHCDNCLGVMIKPSADSRSL